MLFRCKCVAKHSLLQIKVGSKRLSHCKIAALRPYIPYHIIFFENIINTQSTKNLTMFHQRGTCLDESTRFTESLINVTFNTKCNITRDIFPFNIASSLFVAFDSFL